MAATPASSRVERLTSWWDSPAGQRLLAEQQPLLAAEARRFHGDSLLWIGCHSLAAENVRRCMVRNRFYAAIPGSCPDAKLTNFAALAQHLPLPNGSMNAVVLHHTVECADDPRQVMREASRVLAPGGRLVLCGFNPWSLWGLGNLMRRAGGVTRGHPGVGERFISHRRLLDWLAVLGFEFNNPVRFAGYNLGRGGRGRRGLATQEWLTRLQPPIASSFVVSATKQAMSVRPLLRDSNLPRGKLAPVAYPKLNAWNQTESDK